jgi:hypothetical protein
VAILKIKEDSLETRLVELMETGKGGGKEVSQLGRKV